MEPFILLTQNTTFELPNFGVFVFWTLTTKYVFTLVSALMFFLTNSLPRKLKRASKDLLVGNTWQCLWVLGPQWANESCCNYRESSLQCSNSHLSTKYTFAFLDDIRGMALNSHVGTWGEGEQDQTCSSQGCQAQCFWRTLLPVEWGMLNFICIHWK